MKEYFLTGTAAEVTPVARIGDYSFTPSDACRQLVTAYDDLSMAGSALISLDQALLLPGDLPVIFHLRTA